MALVLADAGLDVLLLEKRDEIGIPVRCAEATGSRAELERFVEVPDEWITDSIDGARLISPGGKMFEKSFPGVGVMLDRTRFDAGLAEAAAARGAEVRTSTEVTGLLRDGDRVTGVTVANRAGDAAPDIDIPARLVVGADGVESLIGRWAGLPTLWKSTEIFSCLEAKVKSSRQGDSVLEFYFGNDVAPGGYGWAFPGGGPIWNVGVGIDATRSGRVPAGPFAERLIDRFDPDCERLEWLGGAACKSPSLAKIYGEGIVLVGDAAHQPNPLTGGGIMNAMEAAAIAGECAAVGLRSGDLTAELARYQKEWHRSVGRVNDVYFRMAELVYRYSDDQLDTLCERIASLLDHQSGHVRPLLFLRDLLSLPRDFVLASLRIIPVNRWAIF